MGLEATNDPSDADITALIVVADAEIDKELDAQSASDNVIKLLSALKTAMLIANNFPHSIAVGNLRIDSYRIAQWRQQVDRIMQTYGILDELAGPRVVAWDER